ncbi:MAG: response regulator [Chloroflexota bacterium]
MIRVLVADDFDIMMEAIRRLIETYEDVQIVDEVTRFEELLETIIDDAQDVVLVNDYVPPMDSGRAVRKLRELGITKPVLVMSMHRDVDNICRSLEAGANGYILKEEFLDELLPALRAVHRGEQYLSPLTTAVLEEEE